MANKFKIKGHTDIILTDVKTGKTEVHRDDNLITNAVVRFFDNCGFLNYPDIDKNNLVELLFGGIMAFDDEITESANQIVVPAGLKMTANGSVGTVNNSEVLELGSYSDTESGWQEDGSYVQTYDYTTSQANGTIACVCLTGKNFAYAGEGNSISLKRHATTKSIIELSGSVTSQQGIVGHIFNVDLTDSSCYAFDLSDAETTNKGILRKYRIPTEKINPKHTLLNPVILSETEVSLSNDLVTAITNNALATQANNGNLVLWNLNKAYSMEEITWGNGFTQHIWTLTPAGTITDSTPSNTSGTTLYGIQAGIFDGDYCFFPEENYIQAGTVPYSIIDTTSLCALKLSTGSIDIIDATDIGYRRETYDSDDLLSGRDYVGWFLHHGSGDGRIYTLGSDYSMVVDAVLQKAYPTNANSYNNGAMQKVQNLIYRNESANLNLYRSQGFIASINNLASPIVKTADKTMKIVYRLTFTDIS